MSNFFKSYSDYFDRKPVRQDTDYLDKFTRLLAGENISIVEIQGAPTASFNLQNRTITLPIFDETRSHVNRNKNVSILFRAHEVGHALYTPSSIFHVNVNKSELYSRRVCQCINLVEDIRIERLMKNRFVGLVYIFQQAYTVLVDCGFFGDTTSDEFGSNIFDRINLRSKIGAKLFHKYNIKFTGNEEAVYSHIADARTPEEVIERAIYLESLLDTLQHDLNQEPQKYLIKVKKQKAGEELTGEVFEIPEGADVEFEFEEDDDEEQDGGEGEEESDGNDNKETDFNDDIDGLDEKSQKESNKEPEKSIKDLKQQLDEFGDEVENATAEYKDVSEALCAFNDSSANYKSDWVSMPLIVVAAIEVTTDSETNNFVKKYRQQRLTRVF